MTALIFLKIMNIKEVSYFEIEQNEWVRVFRDQKYQKIVHDNSFGLARFFSYTVKFLNQHKIVHDHKIKYLSWTKITD